MDNSTTAAQISTSLQKLNEECDTINESDLRKEAARLRALSATKDLVANLENPTETIFQQILSVLTAHSYLLLIEQTSSGLF